MSIEVKTKGKNYGTCSICEEKNKRMSKDHIPPQCCGNKGRFVFTRLIKEERLPQELIAQNGITFHYICKECNNFMGLNYDKELACFRNLFFELIEKGTSDVTIDFNKVAKCIVGHFLASYEYCDSVVQNRLRAFFNDTEKKNELLENYSLYCYLYPYENNLFILNEYYSCSFTKDKKDDGFYSSLYFYPFAFLLAEKNKFGTRSDILYCIKNDTPFITLSKDWQDGEKFKSPIWPADVNNSKGIMVGYSAKSCVIVKNN